MQIADLISENKNGKNFHLPFGDVSLSQKLCVYFGTIRKYDGLAATAKKDFLT